MVDRCFMRTCPPDLQAILPDGNTSLDWERCHNPVTFAVRDTHAFGGWLLLCAKHSKGFEHFNRKSEQWE